MKKMERQLRLWLFSKLMNWATDVLPKEDCERTWIWLAKMPIEK